jgi:hypothetical protein
MSDKFEDAVEKQSVAVAVGAAAGIATGLAQTAAPHLRGPGTFVANNSAQFYNSATSALKNHKGITGAAGAGAAAVLHGVGATTIGAAVAAVAAPVVVAAAVGGAVYGLFKLVQKINDEW